MKQEIFRDISGYEGKYQVSNLGNIKSINYRGAGKEKILQIKVSNRGYVDYKLSKNNSYKRYLIHRLVAQTFIPNPENKPQVNHKNGIKNDNRVENLEWVTSKENIRHSWDNGMSSVSILNPFILNHPGKKKVGKFNKEFDLIKIFNSAKEASIEIGIHKQNISDCCRGKKKYIRGFIYKYI